MAEQLSKWSHWHNRSAILQNGKKLHGVKEEHNVPKTLPCGTPDTTLTSLLLQPSLTMCCDRFDRNSVNIDNAEPIMHTEQSLFIKNSLMVDPIKGCDEINLNNPSHLPILQCTLQCMRHTQMYITGTQTFLISKLGV